MIIKNQTWYQGEVTLETNLKEFGMDSLDEVELIMELEESFEVDIPDNDIGTKDLHSVWKTVGDLVKYIKSKTEGE